MWHSLAGSAPTSLDNDFKVKNKEEDSQAGWASRLFSVEENEFPESEKSLADFHLSGTATVG